MNNLRSALVSCALFTFIVTTVTISFATSPSEDAWQFNLAPFYLWGITIDGDLSTSTNILPGTGQLSESIDVPFDDIFDSLEGAFIVHFEAMHKSNWGLLVDVNYLDLGNDFTMSSGVDVKVDFEATLAEVAGLYRIQRDAHYFDAIFGLRGYRMDPGVTFANSPKVVDKSEDWLDPFVGGRWTWNVAEGWALVARADIGGFGLGSDLSWQALGLVEWQPFEYASFLAGYKALDVDYEDGSGNDYFKFDATFHGPMIGLKFIW